MNTTDKIMTIVGEAFREGFYSVRTYNDTVLNNADEEFRSAATSLAKKVIAEIEALVRDAERYRHLRNSVLVDGEINEDMYVHVDHPSYPNRWALIGDELDEAVDNAMQEKQS